jgi:hypothetical protein
MPDELYINADCPAGLERVMFEKLVLSKLIDLKLSRREMKHEIKGMNDTSKV